MKKFIKNVFDVFVWASEERKREKKRLMMVYATLAVKGATSTAIKEGQKMIIEISQKKAQDLKSIEKAIKNQWFTVWTPERIKAAFNFGNGSQKHFNNYMRNNKEFCIFKELTEKEINCILGGSAT